MSAAITIDPLLEFICQWSAVVDQIGDMPNGQAEAFMREKVSPFELLARDGPLPAATTAAGAVAALTKALSYGDMEEQDANLVRAALAFLDGVAV